MLGCLDTRARSDICFFGLCVEIPANLMLVTLELRERLKLAAPDCDWSVGESDGAINIIVTDRATGRMTDWIISKSQIKAAVDSGTIEQFVVDLATNIIMKCDEQEARPH
jgi:hypothetical protein